MVRSTGTTLVFLFLLAGSLVWLALRPIGLHEPVAVVFADAPRQPGARADLVQPAPERPLPGRSARQDGAAEARTLSAPRERTRAAGGAPRGPVRVHGQVRRHGRAVAGYDLAFQPMGATLEGDGGDWDFTDESGRYEVLLPAGGYVVVNDEDRSWVTTVLVPGGADELAADIELPSGIVRGRVVCARSGAGVAGATVVLRREATPRADAMTEGIMARGGEVRSHADGSFELTDVRPGSYLVAAEHQGLHGATTSILVNDGPVEGVQLVLQPGHTLEGVVRGPGGEPAAMDLLLCPGRRVTSLAQLLAGREAYTGSDGALLVPGLPPGPIAVFGVGDSDGGELALQAVVDFHPGEPIALAAQDCGALSISVTRSGGGAAPGAYVDLRARDGAPVLASLEWLEDAPTSDGLGRIELDDVMPGAYRVAAGARGRLGPAVDVLVRPGETAALRLTLSEH